MTIVIGYEYVRIKQRTGVRHPRKQGTVKLSVSGLLEIRNLTLSVTGGVVIKIVQIVSALELN